MKSLYLESRSCLRKRRFDSPKAARTFLRKLKEKYPDTCDQYVYHCTSCGACHLTKNKNAEGKEI